MSNYVFVYRVPRGFTPGDPDATAAWTAWFQGISDHVVELGKPVFTRHEVGAAPGDTQLGGYSLISAADLDEAVRLSDGCPALSTSTIVRERSSENTMCSAPDCPKSFSGHRKPYESIGGNTFCADQPPAPRVAT